MLLSKQRNLPVDHQDIDLKFSGSFSDINIENPAKYCEVSMSRKKAI